MYSLFLSFSFFIFSIFNPPLALCSLSLPGCVAVHMLALLLSVYTMLNPSRCLNTHISLNYKLLSSLLSAQHFFLLPVIPLFLLLTVQSIFNLIVSWWSFSCKNGIFYGDILNWYEIVDLANNTMTYVLIPCNYSTLTNAQPLCQTTNTASGFFLFLFLM